MSHLSRRIPAAGPGVLVFLTFVLAGCGGESGGARWTGTVDTLSSGAVLVSNPAEGLWAPDEAWSLVEELRIGRVEGGGAEVFAGVDGLEVDPEGRVYVLDAEAGEVRVFRPRGEHLRTLGGKGQGPGEFQRPVGVDWVEGEGLWIPDTRNARYSLFGPEGDFVRSRPRQLYGSSFTWRGAVTAGGQIVDYGFVREEDGSTPVLYAVDDDGTAADTFFLPAYEGERYTIRGNNFTMEMTVPFTPELVWRYHPEGFLWFGVPRDYRLYKRTLQGDTLRVVERPYEPVPVSARERAEREDELRDHDLDLGRIPDVKPAYDAIFWDEEGRLWVRVEGSPDTDDRLLDVFDPEGRYLGQVRSPVPILANPPPVIRDDAIWAATRDELDVEYVVRLGIRRPSPAAAPQ